MKAYIGDGVYADVENGMVKLTTENGVETTNTVFMEPAVWAALEESMGNGRHTGPSRHQTHEAFLLGRGWTLAPEENAPTGSRRRHRRAAASMTAPYPSLDQIAPILGPRAVAVLLALLALFAVIAFESWVMTPRAPEAERSHR